MILALVSLSCLFLVSCTTKIPRAEVSFHTQTASGEMKNMVFIYNYQGKKLNMRKMPDFVLSDMKSYRPFPAKKNKKTFGAMFLLERVAANRLVHYSTQRQGLYMVSVVNGKVSEPVVIDRPINDGVLIIWEGLTLRDLRSMDIEIPRTGEDPDEWKDRAKKAKKALKNVIKAEKIKKKS